MKKLFTTLCLVMATMSLLGQDFTYDGINYTIINEAQKVCMTKAGTEINDGQSFYPNEYTPGNNVEGAITIPENVYMDGQPYTVVLIGIGSFAQNKITSLVMPNTVTEIGAGAFANCEDLESVQLSESLTTINNGAFQFCTALKSIIIPNSVSEMKKFVFEGCSNLVSAVISNSLTFLDHAVFRDCISLTEVVLPESITMFGDGGGGMGSCFENCVSLKNLTIPPYLEYIGWDVFEGCTSLESIDLPDTLTILQYSAFKGCSGLKSVKLSNSLRYLENMTFENCSSLESIDIPESVGYIGWHVFSGCTSLKSVTISSNVRSIGGETFMNCSQLQEMFCYRVTPPSCDATLFNNVFLSYSTLHVPVGTKEEYSNATAWKGFGNIIDDLPVSAQNVSLNYNSLQLNLNESYQLVATVDPVNTTEEIVWTTSDESIVSVSDNGLIQTKSYGNAIITATCGNVSASCYVEVLPIITDETFKYLILDEDSKIVSLYGLNVSNDEVLGAVNVDETVSYNNATYTVVEIGGYALASCKQLITITLPSSITCIGTGAFMDCTSLEKIYFDDNINNFGTAAFFGCINLRSIIIPDGIQSIPSQFLQGCSSISEILIPNSVTSIGENAFQGCSSLRNIDLGTGVYNIGDYAFADCPNITDIHSMALNPPIAETYTFPTESYTKATVTVQEQALTTYNNQNPWYRFQNYLTVSGAISLSHYNVDMAGNEVFQLGVYGSDSEIKWSSSNPAVAYANDCGLIVAMGITGATVITATVDGEEIKCNVTVSSPYRDPQAYYSTRAGEDDEDLQPVDVIMEGVSGNPPMVNVRLVPVGSKTIIDWTSSNPALASVQNGIVTVHADGDVDFGVETENGLEETIEVDTKGIDNAGIESIFSDTDIMTPMNVYDLNGRIIYFNATLEQIKGLDKGLYIIKGKKVLVK